jgi:carboxyl-terminal processing protease
LTVLRGSSRDPHELELVREQLSAPEVTGRMVSPDVGYLRIAAFGPDVADQITLRIGELTGEGARQLVVDIRQTAEGSLDTGLDAARLFVESGPLVVREEQGATRETIRASASDGTVRQPLVLLVNTGTAGAAELFTAGLVANDRAEVVGRQTLGRAALQKLVSLPNGSGLLLSWARFLTTSGTPIHQQGLQPDVVVDEPDLTFGAAPPDEDPVLDKALDLLATDSAA